MRSTWARSGRRLNGGDRSPVLDVVRELIGVKRRPDQAAALASEIGQLAEVALAIHERRADRQGRRPQGLDGAGHSDRGPPRAAAEDAGRDRPAKSVLPWWRATRATAMNTISWSGNGPGWSRRAVPTCCCATCGMSHAQLAGVRERAFGSAAKCLAAAAEASAAKGQVDVGRARAAARRRAGHPGRLARLPRNRHRRRRRQDQHAFDRQGYERVGICTL